MADDYGKYMPGLYKYLSDKQTDDTVEPENDPLTTAAGVALTGPALGAIDAAAPAMAGLAGDEAGVLRLNKLRGLMGSAMPEENAMIADGAPTAAPITSAPPDADKIQALAKAASDAYSNYGIKSPEFAKAQNALNRASDYASGVLGQKLKQ